MSKKKLLVFTIPLLISVISIAAINVYTMWQHAHPLSHPEYGFQPYRPQGLPDGQQIIESRIDVIQSGDKIYGIDVEMNLRPAPHNWIYSISERRARGHEKDTRETATSLRNFNTSSVRPTCTQRITPQKRSYRLCHWTDYGRISVYELNFIEIETLVSTKFPTDIDHVIAMDELDTYVDSFVPSKPPQEITRGI